MSDTVSQIDLYYTNILQRQPDTGGLNYFVSQASSGTPLAQIETEIIQSPESQADVVPVVELYQTLFGRVPDQGGLDYFVNELRGGMSLAQIATQMVTSPEGVGDFGAGAPVDAATITTLYENALGRAPSPSEITYQESVGSLGAIAAEISQSAEAQARLYGPTVSFLTAAGNGTESYQGSLVPSGATVYLNLEQTQYTGGVSGHTTFIAAPEVSSIGLLTNTIQSADVITGQGTGNVLQMQVVLDLNTILNGETVTPTLTGVQDVQFYNSSNNTSFSGAGFTLDLINSTGVTQGDVINSTNGEFNLANASQLTTVTLQNSGGAYFGVSANSTAGLGVTTASITNSGASAAFGTELNLIGEASSKLTLNVSNSPDNTSNSGHNYVTVDVSGYTATQGVKDLTLNLTSSAGATAANPNELDLGVTGGPNLSTLTIAAAGAESLYLFNNGSGDDAAAAAAVTVTGTGGSLDFTTGDAFNAVKTFTASAYSGDLSVAIVSDTNLTSITTGAGNDSVDLTGEGNYTGAFSVNLGAGDDTLLLGASVVTHGSFDGAAGTNILGITNGATTTQAGNSFANFPILEIGQAGDSLHGFGIGGFGNYDLSQIGGLTTVDITSTNGGSALSGNVQLNNAPDGLTINANASADTTWFDGYDFNVALSHTADSNHSLTLNLNASNTSSAGQGIVDFSSVTIGNLNGLSSFGPAHVETITINSNGTAGATPDFDHNHIGNLYLPDATSLDVHATLSLQIDNDVGYWNSLTTLTASGSGTYVDMDTAATSANSLAAPITSVDVSGLTPSGSGTGGDFHAIILNQSASTSPLTYTGAGGSDYVYVSQTTDATHHPQFTGGTGADYFQLADQGSDQFSFVSATDALATDPNNSSAPLADFLGQTNLNASLGAVTTPTIYNEAISARMETIIGFQVGTGGGDTADTLHFSPAATPFNIIVGGAGSALGPIALSAATDIQHITGLFQTAGGTAGVVVGIADSHDAFVFVNTHNSNDFDLGTDQVIHLHTADAVSAANLPHVVIA